MNHQEKIASISSNTEKMIVRKHIDKQVECYIRNGNFKKLDGITLPAKDHALEKLIYSNFHDFLVAKYVPEIKFYCAEKNPNALKEGIKTRPECCTTSLLKIEELISEPISFDKNRIGRIDYKNGEVISNYNFLWADYCQRFNKKTLDNLLNKIAIKKDIRGLYYLTFSLSRTNHRKIIKSLKAPVHKGIQNAVNKYILRQFQRKCDKKAKLIYSNYYIGGRRSSMITIGILSGKVYVPTLFVNRYELNEKNNHKNSQLFNRVKNRSSKWFKKLRRERKNKKPYKTVKLILQDKCQITAYYNTYKSKGMKGKEISNKIASLKFFIRRKISVRQISAVISWITSPKLKAKMVN